jgi:hypothetical protein
MNIKTAFPSNYLKAAELTGDVTYTIKGVEVETLGQGKDAEDKPVVYFNESDKGLVLNKTNAATIGEMYGDETNNWIGKRITVYPASVPFQGKMTQAIRVRTLTEMRMSQPAPANAPQNGAGGASKGSAWKAFTAKVAQYNRDNPGDVWDTVKTQEMFRSMVGEAFPGREPQTLNGEEWQAILKMIENYSPALAAELPSERHLPAFSRYVTSGYSRGEDL